MEQLLRLFPAQHALVALVLGVLVAVARYRWRVADDRRGAAIEAGAWGGIAFGLLLTASITLVSHTPAAAGTGSVDLVLRSPSLAQALVNLALFWWVALLLPLARRTGVTATTATVVAASIVVELLQWALPTGRSPALMDVLLNTLGGFLLALVAVYLVRPAVRLRPTRPAATIAR
ncbi:VanZ family protein [Actinotalea sp. C106]|uniref:VanZ family protein n=1 Tax=Actinotalea sp. C106 TaxID=2908644 RepID=UPI002028689E|nr:VanZ family protein [Actinotalea sp. C106]